MTSRIRNARARGDAGAVAVIVAIVSLVLFGTAALAIDLGSMYSRRRAAQTDADFAALAGAVALPDQAAARALAYEYLQKNLPAGGPIGALANYSDGVLANGEVLFPSAYKIRVVVPNRKVEFGFAGAMGFSEADVSAAATVEVKSPASTMPFFLTVGAASGYTCLKDGSGGGNSAMRAALLAPPTKPPNIGSVSPSSVSTAGGQTVTVTGSNFKNPNVTSVKIDGVEVTTWSVNGAGNTITLTAPAHAAGSATLVVTNADGFDSDTLTYAAAPPAAAPTVTGISPASGPVSGGTVVTITGTNFTGATGVMFGTTPAVNPTITNATTMQATAPAGTGAVHVTVTGPGGTSATNTADLFTYEIDSCEGTTGSFGYLNVGRSTPPAPSGANSLVQINAIKGIDHSWTTFPTGLLPGLGIECKTGNTTLTGAILDDGNGVDGANCVDIQNGNKTNDVAQALLDGYTQSNPDLDPRLEATSGHLSGPLHGRSGMDLDHIDAYLSDGVTIEMFTNALDNGTVTPEWLKPEIMTCPRFAIVPVLNVNTNPPNGFYPIKGFAGVFIDGVSPNHGLDPNNNGNQIETIRAYTFSLDFLPGVISAGTTEGTVTFMGSGPKVPVLIHDVADPSY